MQYIKHVCPKCGYEAPEPGSCPNCKSTLVATCAICGNPVVGEQIQL